MLGVPVAFRFLPTRRRTKVYQPLLLALPPAQVMDGTERDSGTSLAATNPRWLSPEVLHGGSATFASVRLSHAP